MHFIRFILMTGICLMVSISAAPLSTLEVLSTRKIEAPAIVTRSPPPPLHPHQLSQHIVATQKHQAHKNNVVKPKKSKANKAITDRVAKVQASDRKLHLLEQAKLKNNWTDKQHAAARKAAHQKANDKAKSQAISNKQKQGKKDRVERWKNAIKPPKVRLNGPKPPKVRLNGYEKDVRGAIRDAAHRMRTTVNIPHKKDIFTVGRHTTTGKEVRKAVMNSYLHTAVPLGPDHNKAPKQFRNDPYSPTHGDAGLRDKRPIHNPTHAPLNEYPATKQGQGWIGTGKVGPSRVITSSQGTRNTFHGVIAHDTTRGGDHEDHYIATHTHHI